VQLFMARMSVGVGEATLSPCTMSMISDSFPKERRARPIAFYTMALSVGAGIASLVSAAVLRWAKSVSSIELPLVGTVEPWQFTFIIVGLPGLILAILMFTLREPRRQATVADPGRIGSANNGLSDMLRHVAGNWAVFLPFCLFSAL